MPLEVAPAGSCGWAASSLTRGNVAGRVAPGPALWRAWARVQVAQCGPTRARAADLAVIGRTL